MKKYIYSELHRHLTTEKPTWQGVIISTIIGIVIGLSIGFWLLKVLF